MGIEAFSAGKRLTVSLSKTFIRSNYEDKTGNRPEMTEKLLTRT